MMQLQNKSLYFLIVGDFNGVPSSGDRRLQRGDHALSRHHATIKVGVAEGVATTDEQRAIQDGHVTGTVQHRGQHLQDAAALSVQS